MSEKRFMITGIEKGCYRIGTVKDRRKDTGSLGSVKLSELTGESCILDMLNQLNNENEQLKQTINSQQLTITNKQSIIEELFERKEFCEKMAQNLKNENEQLKSENKKLQCINDQLEERLESSGIGVALKMDCDMNDRF